MDFSDNLITIYFMDNENFERFKTIKNESENYYNNLVAVYCPYFKKNIVFNSKGLNHIKMKDWAKPRIMSDQYLRFKFLRLVPEILNLSGTLQDFREMKKRERIKLGIRWKLREKTVKYYGFVAIIGGARIKIIIKNINVGELFFWSIIPFWKNKRDELSGEIKKVFHEGDLETQ